eukprot:5630976-Pyramimonas_sp.AAC.1
MPYRDWCKWCLWGRGKEDGRKKASPEEAPTIPVISMDYCFVNTELETEMVNILVMVQKPEDAVASIMVIHRGPSEYVNSAVDFYLDVWGAADIILKGDQEPSLQAVITA